MPVSGMQVKRKRCFSQACAATYLLQGMADAAGEFPTVAVQLTMSIKLCLRRDRIIQVEFGGARRACDLELSSSNPETCRNHGELVQ